MRPMLPMLRDLVAHKGYANASLLNAIRHNATAAADSDVWELLHHIVLANRFWMLSIVGLPFDLDEESRRADSFDALIERYARTQAQEAAWLDAAAESDVERILKNSLIPNGECSVAQALVQVCMHSHAHRAQIAKLLRAHGGAAPATEFILWLTNRPSAAWPGGIEIEPTY
jgi:uncharacterized damage-inducible protein DinB